MRQKIGRAWKAGWGLFVFLLAAAPGCGPHETPFVYQGIYKMVEPTSDYSKTYTDQSITMQFFIQEKRIFFDLRNKTDETILVIWNDAVFYGADGTAQRLINSKNMFTENLTLMEPTLIPPNSSIRDSMVPEKHMVLLEEWTWYLEPLFDFISSDAKKLKGKTFVLEIPMEVKRYPRVYTFTFEVAQVIAKEKKLTPELPIHRGRSGF